MGHLDTGPKSGAAAIEFIQVGEDDDGLSMTLNLKTLKVKTVPSS